MIPQFKLVVAIVIISGVCFGSIINLWSLFMFTSNTTLESVIAIYTSAIPFDLIHSIASIVFIYVLIC